MEQITYTIEHLKDNLSSISWSVKECTYNDKQAFKITYTPDRGESFSFYINKTEDVNEFKSYVKQAADNFDVDKEVRNKILNNPDKTVEELLFSTKEEKCCLDYLANYIYDELVFPQPKRDTKVYNVTNYTLLKDTINVEAETKTEALKIVNELNSYNLLSDFFDFRSNVYNYNTIEEGSSKSARSHTYNWGDLNLNDNIITVSKSAYYWRGDELNGKVYISYLPKVEDNTIYCIPEINYEDENGEYYNAMGSVFPVDSKELVEELSNIEGYDVDACVTFLNHLEAACKDQLNHYQNILWKEIEDSMKKSNE